MHIYTYIYIYIYCFFVELRTLRSNLYIWTSGQTCRQSLHIWNGVYRERVWRKRPPRGPCVHIYIYTYIHKLMAFRLQKCTRSQALHAHGMRLRRPLRGQRLRRGEIVVGNPFEIANNTLQQHRNIKRHPTLQRHCPGPPRRDSTIQHLSRRPPAQRVCGGG